MLAPLFLKSRFILTCTLIQEISQETSHYCLVADDQHIALSLQFHDDRLETLDKVLVGLHRKSICQNT